MWVMRQVGYDEGVESEAGTDDELLEPEPGPEAPKKKVSPPEPPISRSSSSGSFAWIYLCFVMNMREYDSSRRKPAIYFIPGTLPSAPSTEDLVTPKHAAAGPGNSPETGEKLPAPSKRELLKALTEQQHQLSLLLMAKKKRADEGKAESGILHAARTVRVVT